MARSRVCPACGEDLASIGPVREPRYGLLVVFCPRCGRPTAPRRDTPGRLARGVGLLALAVAALAFKTMIMSGSVCLIVLCAIGATLTLEDNLLDPVTVATTGRADRLAAIARDWDWQGEEFFSSVVMYVCLSGMIGVGAGWSLAHRRLRQGWMILAAGVLGVALLRILWARAQDRWPITLGPPGILTDARTLINLSSALAATLALASAAMPLGRGVAEICGRVHSRLWRSQLARARKRRRP